MPQLATIDECNSPYEGPGQRLARALIGQAFQDALSTSADEHDQRHARAFLTALDGDWAWSRRFWSAIADLSHHDVRKRALLAIERGVDWHQVRRGGLR